MSTKLGIGQIVPLSLQLEDGEDSLPLVIKAAVRKQDGTLFQAEEIELAHVGDGLFKSIELAMPNQAEIVIQYKIYLSDGETLNTDYTIEAESFLLDTEHSASVAQDVVRELLRSSIIGAVPIYVEEV